MDFDQIKKDFEIYFIVFLHFVVMEREFELNQEKRWYKLGAMVGIYIAYLGVGAAIFQYFESPYEVRRFSIKVNAAKVYSSENMLLH